MKKNTLKILEALDAQYGREYVCYLDHENAWQLLIATMLSAQCTDARVNIVTKDLFQKYRSVEDFAKADLKELEKDIHSTGFYHNKAKNIITCCNQLLERHGGEVPSDIESLTALAGVGRKTANLVLGDAFNKPSYVVDTHCIRICGRIGLTQNTDPVKIEMDLRTILPPDENNPTESSGFCHRLVHHGRALCPARSPKCKICPIGSAGICNYCSNNTFN